MAKSGGTSTATMLLAVSLLTFVLSVGAVQVVGDFGIVNPTSGLNFTFRGFREANRPKPGPNQVALVPAFAGQFPGLKGLDISAVYFDFAPWSQVTPHSHPRGSEIFYVIKGVVDVGFVDTTNTIFKKRLYKGDVFVFPRGLVHYQRNNQSTRAKGIAVLNSESPGLQATAYALFTSGIPDNVLAAALNVNESTIGWIKQGLGK